MARRTCANCRAIEWPKYRWCEDCLRAGAKVLAAAVATELAGWLLHRFAF